MLRHSRRDQQSGRVRSPAGRLAYSTRPVAVRATVSASASSRMRMAVGAAAQTLRSRRSCRILYLPCHGAQRNCGPAPAPHAVAADRLPGFPDATSADRRSGDRPLHAPSRRAVRQPMRRRLASPVRGQRSQPKTFIGVSKNVQDSECPSNTPRPAATSVTVLPIVVRANRRSCTPPTLLPALNLELSEHSCCPLCLNPSTCLFSLSLLDLSFRLQSNP